ncbi:MAG: dihydrofolate reductase family protein [Marinilabiliales bacterium]|nr:dihydrofolate reductase family protein [Marinilabiliales bacterium]
MKNNRRAILYIAMSLDGYIAAPGDDLGFLDPMQREGEDYGYGHFIQSVDTVITGRRTHDWVMRHAPDFAHADKACYILTRNPKPNTGSTRFYTGDPAELIRHLKSLPGKDLFIEGGSEILHELLKQQLIDEFILSIVPVLVGDGIPLFREGRPPQTLELVDVTRFDSGLVQLRYLGL